MKKASQSVKNGSWFVEKLAAVGLRVGLQEPFDTPPQVGVVAADPVKVIGTLRGRRQFEGVAEDVREFGFGWVHDFTCTIPVPEVMRVLGRKGATKKSTLLAEHHHILTRLDAVADWWKPASLVAG